MLSRRALAIVLQPSHLKGTCLVARVVGALLSVVNLGGQLLWGPWNLPMAIKIAMNVLTPFVVANLGLMLRQGGSETDS